MWRKSRLHRFTIALEFHLALGLVLHLVAHLRAVSPTRCSCPWSICETRWDSLEDRHLDLAIDMADNAPSSLFSRTLPASSAMCLSRPDHPLGTGPIPHADLLRFPSSRVGAAQGAVFGDIGDCLEALQSSGEDVTLLDNHTAVRMLRESDAAMILPAASARFISAHYGLKAFLPGSSGLDSARTSSATAPGY